MPNQPDPNEHPKQEKETGEAHDPNEPLIKQQEETLEAQVSRAGPQLNQLGEFVGAMQRVVSKSSIPADIILFGIYTFLLAMVHSGLVDRADMINELVKMIGLFSGEAN
jgi:hypothetical protein